MAFDPAAPPTAGEALMQLILELDVEYEQGTSRDALNTPSYGRLARTPAEPRADLRRERVERHTSDVQTAVAAFLSSIRERHNDSVTMAKLHDELLVRVLDEAQHHQRDIASMLLFSRVCKRWRRVITSHAPFWAVVSIDADSARLEGQLQFANLCLARSPTVPLRFIFQHLLATPNVPQSVQVALETLLFNISQVSQLSLCFSKHTLPVFAYLSTNHHAANLQSLVVSLANSHPSFSRALGPRWYQENILTSRDLIPGLEVFPLFADYFPKLRELSLRGFHAPWNASIYNNLTSLTLFHIPVLEPWENFVNALRRSPYLENLSLWFNTMPSHGHLQRVDPVGSSSVSLDRLTALHLVSFTPVDVRTFFADVSVPGNVSVNITVPVLPGVGQARIWDVLYDFPATIQAHLHHVQKLWLYTTGNHRLLNLDQFGQTMHRWIINMELLDHANSQSSEYTFKESLDFFRGVTELGFEGEFRGYSPRDLGKHSISTLTLVGVDTIHIIQEVLPGGFFHSISRLNLHNMPSLDAYCGIMDSTTIRTLEIKDTSEDNARRLIIAARYSGIEVLV